MRSAGPEPDRVVLVLSELTDGARYNAGSGYLITEGLAITAGHVVANANTISVQTAISNESYSAVVELLDSEADVALITISLGRTGAPQMSPVRFNPDTTWASGDARDATAVGFPSFAEHREPGKGVPELQQVFGRVAPLSGSRSGTFELLVESRPAAHEGASPWAGMAGAPLWIDGEIVGVINAAAKDATRLFAVRADRLIANPKFARLVGSRTERDESTDHRGPPAEPGLRQQVLQGDQAAPRDLGRVHEQRGNLDEAEVWYRRAADAGDQAALRDLGRVLEQRGNLDEAEVWYRRAADAGD